MPVANPCGNRLAAGWIGLDFVAMQFPIPAILGLGYGLSEIGLGLLKRSRDDSVDADDSTLRTLWIAIVLAVTAGIVASLRLPAASIDARTSLWLGCALFALGLGLRWYSIVYLGRFFTVNVAIHSSHEVIDTGPYSRVRHPSYTGALLAFFGLALCMANWASLLIVMLPIFWAFARRMTLEETALSSALGTPYINYMRRTKRLAPFVY
jgi:protein-S-isoprenylcysteine O-methyltransferase